MSTPIKVPAPDGHPNSDVPLHQFTWRGHTINTAPPPGFPDNNPFTQSDSFDQSHHSQQQSNQSYQFTQFTQSDHTNQFANQSSHPSQYQSNQSPHSHQTNQFDHQSSHHSNKHHSKQSNHFSRRSTSHSHSLDNSSPFTSQAHSQKEARANMNPVSSLRVILSKHH
jgi:hypothetical protein